MTTIAYSCRNCGWKSGPTNRCVSLESCLACDSVDLDGESDMPDPPRWWRRRWPTSSGSG